MLFSYFIVLFIPRYCASPPPSVPFSTRKPFHKILLASYSLHFGLCSPHIAGAEGVV